MQVYNAVHGFKRAWSVKVRQNTFARMLLFSETIYRLSYLNSMVEGPPS
jgi:hypothetical protein